MATKHTLQSPPLRTLAIRTLWPHNLATVSSLCLSLYLFPHLFLFINSTEEAWTNPLLHRPLPLYQLRHLRSCRLVHRLYFCVSSVPWQLLPYHANYNGRGNLSGLSNWVLCYVYKIYRAYDMSCYGILGKILRRTWLKERKYRDRGN
jgi:hypothetical protein